MLGQIKARIRAEVFHALEEDTEPSPPLGNENMFINELIREYYEFNKYKYSLSVMLAGKYVLYVCTMYMNGVFSSESDFSQFLCTIYVDIIFVSQQGRKNVPIRCLQHCTYMC